MTDQTETPIAGPGVAPQDHNQPPLAELLNEKPQLLFEDKDALKQFYASIEKEIAEHPVDLETEKGRKALKSLAFSIVTRKTEFDEVGAKLVEKHRSEVKRVDALRKDFRDKMDGYRDLAKKPVTDWESKESLRLEKINRARELYRVAAIVTVDATLQGLANTKKMVEDTPVDAALFGGYAEAATTERQKALDAIDAAAERIRNAEAERAELARLQAEERQRQEAAAAVERKRLADEAEAQRLKDLEEAKARAAQEAEERTRREVEEKARQEQVARDNAAAEAARKAADEQRQRDEAAAAKVRAAEEAQAKAERDAEALRQAEEARQRAQAEEAARQAKAAKGMTPRAKAVRETRDAITSVVRMSNEEAIELIKAIAAGRIPHVTITLPAKAEQQTQGK